MALHDPITLPSRDAALDSFVALLKADATFVGYCTPGGIYRAEEAPADLPGDGVDSWVRVLVWQLPISGTPLWDTQMKARLQCQAVTQRIAPTDQPERRLELIHQAILNLVAGQKPLASMVIGYSAVTFPETATFIEERKDVTRSNVEYQFVIR